MSYDFYITPEEYDQAEANGIKQATLEYRVRGAGWKKEEAIKTKTRKREEIPKWVLDKAEKNNICYGTLTRRIHQGWDYERACTQLSVSTSDNAIAQSEKLRKYPKEFTDLAISNGIQLKTFYYRMKAGWDIYKAATHKPLTAKEKMAKARENSAWKSDHNRYVGKRGN